MRFSISIRTCDDFEFGLVKCIFFASAIVNIVFKRRCDSIIRAHYDSPYVAVGVRVGARVADGFEDSVGVFVCPRLAAVVGVVLHDAVPDPLVGEQRVAEVILQRRAIAHSVCFRIYDVFVIADGVVDGERCHAFSINVQHNERESGFERNDRYYGLARAIAVSEWWSDDDCVSNALGAPIL